MGPRSIGRGIVRGDCGGDDRRAASMGPRSIDRGIVFPTSDPSVTEMLQWGRDQLIAELSPTASGMVPLVLLQWGRAQLSAELCFQPPIHQSLKCFNGAAIN